MRKPFERPRRFECLHVFLGVGGLGRNPRSLEGVQPKKKVLEVSSKQKKITGASELDHLGIVGCRNAKPFRCY